MGPEIRIGLAHIILPTIVWYCMFLVLRTMMDMPYIGYVGACMGICVPIIHMVGMIKGRMLNSNFKGYIQNRIWFVVMIEALIFGGYVILRVTMIALASNSFSQ